MTDIPLLVLSGSLGAGKSAVLAELHEVLERAEWLAEGER